jgi:hypothetical protein
MAKDKQDLTLTFLFGMQALAKEVISDADEGEMLNNEEVELLSRRATEQLAIETRAKIYVEVMSDEVRQQARRLVEKAIQDKIKKVTGTGLL